MPDRVATDGLARCVPGRVREDVFRPVREELRLTRLARRAGHGAVRRGAADLGYAARLASLVVQCWWIAFADRREPQTPAWSVQPSTPGALAMTFVAQLRHAVRLLWRQPGFTTAAVLTLALGVGANVAVFAVVEAVLLRPLPYPDADELVVLQHRDARTSIEKSFIALGDFIDLAARAQRLGTLANYGSAQVTISGAGEPFRADALTAGRGLLEMLGARALRGRLLSPDDMRAGAAPAMLIGQDLWETAFGSDEGVVGRRLRVGITDREVVGIVARGFRFPASRARDVAVVLPTTLPAMAPAARKSGWLFAVARLAPGTTPEDATAELDAISTQLEQEFPVENQGSRYFVRPLRETLVGDTRRALVLLSAAVSVVLLIACANVGNLLLARALGRRQEMAVRAALGAGRRRLVAQLVGESLVLATLAGLAGIAAAHWGVPALVALVPTGVTVPGLAEVGINGGVLAFTLGLTLISAAVFSVITALSLAGGGEALVSPGRVSAGRAARRAASSLVVVEVALAVMLLVGAGLILRSFANLISTDPGFDASRVLALEVGLPADRYRSPDARGAFFDQAFAELAALPGVAAAGAGVVMPLTGNQWTVGFERADRPVPAGQRPPDVGWQTASGGFFEALRIPLRRGRLFHAADRAPAPPVVIVSESLEREHFGGESAVGRHVRLGTETAEIVGVVGDIRRASLVDAPMPDMYFPFERQPGVATTLFIRTTGEAGAATATIRAALRALEPQVLVAGATTLDEVRRASVAGTTFALWMLALFALIALALAAVGVYGVMSYAVRQRTREIGTRIALGATGRDIQWLVVRQGGALATAGVAIGLVAAWLAARSMTAMLHGVSGSDPRTLAAAVGVIGLASFVACYLPARRASRLDAARTLARG